MSYKVLDINHMGMHFTCIKDTRECYNQYKLYQHWNDYSPETGITKHRRLIDKYADFNSVMSYLNGIMF